MPLQCRVINLGIQDYWQVYDYQQKLVQAKIGGAHRYDTLLLVEHPPVFTIGQTGSKNNLHIMPNRMEEEGITVYEVDRVGDITYHGPGQLVVYPILRLEQHGKDLHKLVWNYEEVVIRTLAEYGITGHRLDKYPGVWVGEDKIAALGIGVEKWVSYHGFSLNINTNLKHYELITSCGISDKGITSMAKILGRTLNMEEVTEHLVEFFAQVFKLEMK